MNTTTPAPTTTTDQEITIRRARTVADFLACQEVQRLSWGIADDSYLVPVATMIGAQYHGGLVLGAFLPGGKAVGMSFAFLGKIDGRLCLYSQLTGISPGHQGRGLGFLLKSAQREAARREKIPCIAWAFDPLQAGNARFNLGKLGAVAIHYHENMYGPRTDALNRDTPTDRLIAIWETDPAATSIPRRTFDDATRMISVSQDPEGRILPSTPTLPPSAFSLLLEIPDDINRLRRERPGLAERWGRVVRKAFQDAFGRGYRAVGFVRDESSGTRRCAYVLAQNTSSMSRFPIAGDFAKELP
jgi:predicted GNAT superfamily acetyltransferase